MKKLTTLIVFAAMIFSVNLNSQSLAPCGGQYRLKKVMPVAGRQGIAIDDK